MNDIRFAFMAVMAVACFMFALLLVVWIKYGASGAEPWALICGFIGLSLCGLSFTIIAMKLFKS